MKFHWLKTVAVSAAALSFALTPSLAQTAMTDWDANADAAVDQQEWNTGWDQAGTFGTLDVNGDGTIDENEFNTGLVANETAGTGADGGEGFSQRFGATAFSDWDQNQDQMLDENELRAGVFSGYDEDQDTRLDEQEFGAFGEDAGQGGIWSNET